MQTVKIDNELLIPSGRHTLPHAEVSERQRERLLRAMVACVGEQGYAATTISDVVRVARTSRSAFYEQFADKEECFIEAYRRMTDAFIDASLEAAAAVDDWLGKLDAGIATYFSWMAQRPEVAVSTVVEVHAAGRSSLQERARALARWRRTIEGVGVLAERAGAKIARPDETSCAAIVLSAEACVHEYALRGRVHMVGEQTGAVQGLARALFAAGGRG